MHNAAEGLGNMFKGATGLAFAVVLPVGLGISMTADPMVRLMLGTQWLASVPVVQIMAVSSISAVFAQPCSAMLNAVGRPHVSFYLSTLSTAVKIVALVILTPILGLRGAAIALAISYVVDMVSFLVVTLPAISVSLWQLAICCVRPSIAGAAMVTVLYCFNMAWTPSTSLDHIAPFWDALIRATVGGVCYAVVLLAAWIAAGRPDGAEQFALAAMQDAWRRVRAAYKRTSIWSVPAG